MTKRKTFFIAVCFAAGAAHGWWDHPCMTRAARELGFSGRIVSAAETNGVYDVIYEYVTGSNGLVRCELALPPAAKWKGWFKGVGNVGAAGGLNKGWVLGPAEGGVAAAMTDMGSSNGRCSRNPVAIRDFGHRATHLMTVGANDCGREAARGHGRRAL